MKTKEYLKSKLIEDIKKYYSNNNNSYILSNQYIDGICQSWLDDENQKVSVKRFEILNKYSPKANKILDMAGGCGTFYFYGFIKGYEMHAIEPEDWKHKLIKMKIEENQYPKEWINNFIDGHGEKLPYKDNYFDCVSSYQTLEHVQNIEKCLIELIRVTKKNGFIHIKCPNYSSTFEGHYKLPWLYVFSKFPSLAKCYLRVLNRPILGLETINDITYKKVMTILRNNFNNDIKIVNLNREKFISKYKIKYLYWLYKLIKYIKIMFRAEYQINILIRKR